MSTQMKGPEFVELSTAEAADLDGGFIVAAALLPWMGKAFVAGVTLGAAAATVYFNNQD